MAWSGYLIFDGTEIANASRTEAYVGAKGWFRPLWADTDLPDMLEESYIDPVADEAPWYDPDIPASKDFWGFYPSDFVGFENSSRTSAVTENTNDGGTPGRVRHGTKSVVCSGALLGATQEAVDYGMNWLRRALVGAVDSNTLTTEQPLGATVGYLAAEPVVNYEIDPSPQSTLTRLSRYLRRVVVNNGPSALFTGKLSCGAHVTTVQFTMVAGSPFEFGPQRAILQDWGSAADPWVPGVPNGVIDGPDAYSDVVCGQDQWAPIFDPDCPALIVPPPPPSIPLGCWTPPSSWSRYTVTIPATVVPLWGQVVPTVTFFTAAEARNIRVRFYEDPGGDGSPADDPCDFVGDFVLSYIPPGGTLILDGTTEDVFVLTSSGYKRRADSLVFRTDGTPFEWPSLTAGIAYILVLDIGTGGAMPVVDLSLTSRAV